MADESMKSRRQLSRLQRRAPASIQVTPANHWSVAIPLLSPLVTSPDLKRNCIEYNNNDSDNNKNKCVSEPEKLNAPLVYKKWQHPAAPFYYEPAPALTLLQSICVDRSC